MKIYRYVSEEELKEIKEKNLFRFWDPTKWGVNEGIIQNTLEKKKESNNKRIIELINTVDKYYKEEANSESYLDVLDDENSLITVFCNLYTEILQYYKLCITSFCQCWTTNPDSIEVSELIDKKYVARIEAETTDQTILTLKNNGKSLEWVIRNSKVYYKDYTYKDNIDDVLKNFYENERKLSFFLKTLQSKHNDQNEIRYIATLTDLNIKGNKLRFHWEKYISQGVKVDDLAQELHKMAVDMKEQYKDICLHQGDDRFIYVNIPDNFIKSIDMLDE